jgi:hypothetical protein
MYDLAYPKYGVDKNAEVGGLNSRHVVVSDDSEEPKRKIFNQDTEKIRPMKFYDRTEWWKKAENPTTEAFGTEESLELLLKTNEVVHNNAMQTHSDRQKIHKKFGRRLVTPTFHGGGGSASDVISEYTKQQRFYVAEKEKERLAYEMRFQRQQQQQRPSAKPNSAGEPVPRESVAVNAGHSEAPENAANTPTSTATATRPQARPVYGPADVFHLWQQSL